MSERALEFVETWVSKKIEKMGDPPKADDAKIKAMAAECVAAARGQGIAQAEIHDAFDDLAAYIAGEIENTKDRETRPDEGMLLIDRDDARVVEDAEDDLEEDEKKR